MSGVRIPVDPLNPPLTASGLNPGKRIEINDGRTALAKPDRWGLVST